MLIVAHTPDNSFLGFVVGEFKRNENPLPKEDIAVVYGKEFYMWKVRGKVRGPMLGQGTGVGNWEGGSRLGRARIQQHEV